MFVLILLLLVLFLPIPIYTLIRMIQSFSQAKRIRRREERTVKIRMIDNFVSLAIYAVLLVGMLLNKFAIPSGEKLSVFELTGERVNGYASLANESVFSVIFLLTLGVVAFSLITMVSDSLSPIVYVLASAVLILNSLFSIFYLTHTGFYHQGETISVVLLQISFLSLLFLYTASLKETLNQFLDEFSKSDKQYTSGLMVYLCKLTNNYQHMSKVWAISLFPLFLIIQFILVLFGQQPNSFIRVFLDTSSFNYSRIPAPKPEIVPGDGHYLCTVSAKGHPKLVKPIRAGLRNGERIPVNRQLLIANAFENVFEQYFPAFHIMIRRFYDQFGYPISKHIQTKRSADMVYLFMKPLEWFFVVVLYTIDKNPENRIHRQYSEWRE